MIERIFIKQKNNNKVVQEFGFSKFTCVVGQDKEDRKQFIDLLLYAITFGLKGKIYPLKTQRYAEKWLKNLINDDFYFGFKCLNDFKRYCVNYTSIDILLNERSDEKELYIIENIENDLNPNEQKVVVPKLKENYPDSQFIITTNSPVIIQSLELGELLDLDNQVNELPADCENLFKCFPCAKGNYYKRSVNEILRNVFEFKE